jgi:ATP-dependent Clp protease ATP-binding subunit ClpA
MTDTTNTTIPDTNVPDANNDISDELEAALSLKESQAENERLATKSHEFEPHIAFVISELLTLCSGTCGLCW